MHSRQHSTCQIKFPARMAHPFSILGFSRVKMDTRTRPMLKKIDDLVNKGLKAKPSASPLLIKWLGSRQL